ncbi:craniofacial development protein 2-like [Palaemon carinicauda]|uniref:craniofacial development protein 2-like n=1 Tax=Palaemon carinicauda TaxID=392227 RepID=UPI0035B6081A
MISTAVQAALKTTACFESTDGLYSDATSTGNYITGYTKCNKSIIVCYAQTYDSPEEREDEHDEYLQNVIDENPERNMKIMIRDLNAGVGNVMGVESFGKVANENGAHFIISCSANNLVIVYTLVQHKNIHKYTCTSPCGNYKNQIDHIAIKKERSSTLRNVRSYKGADIGSDHQLLIATLKLKLKAPNRKINSIPRFDTIKLIEEEHGEAFAIECRNRFAILRDFKRQ